MATNIGRAFSATRKVKTDFLVISRDTDTDPLKLANEILARVRSETQIPPEYRKRLSGRRVKDLAPRFRDVFIEDLDMGRYRLPYEEIALWLSES